MTRGMRCLGHRGRERSPHDNERERERDRGNAAAFLGTAKYQFYRNLICDVALGRSSKFKSHEFVDGDEKIALFPTSGSFHRNTIHAPAIFKHLGGLAVVVYETERKSLFPCEEPTAAIAHAYARLRRIIQAGG